MSSFSDMNPFKKTILTVSAACFMISLTQTCFVTSAGDVKGSITFISGWLGIVAFSPPAFTWLANPMIFFSWRYWLHNKTSLSLILSLGATMLSVCFLFFEDVVLGEGGGGENITGYKLGYWLWLSSMGVMLLGNLIVYLLKVPKSDQRPKVINQS